DGTTHQSIEQLASLRAMPNMCVIRPADANEAVIAWKYALEKTEGPTMLVLTRQKLPIFDRTEVSSANGLSNGAYILSKEQDKQLDAILIATGSEVQLVLEAQKELLNQGINTRVVSMPSWEVFRKQPEAYRNSVLNPDCKSRLAVEAGSLQGWEEWVGEEGAVIGISIFGESAPAKDLFKHYGFTVEHVVSKVKELYNKKS